MAEEGELSKDLRGDINTRFAEFRGDMNTRFTEFLRF